MHRRPSAAATPLAVLPLPPRQRDLASLKSPDSAPHTPTKRAEPLPLFSNTNRYSTDSWNSSNCDGADEMVFEWKPEQVILLSRTLDALPSHLLTPFNGPVPPSNLLDKLARGVAKAKNPVDWPHSIRATRAKIVELARTRAREVKDGSASDTIVEEESDSSDVPLQQTTNIGLKRQFNRQSSMDFMHPPKLDISSNANLSRLSRRLQRTERMLLSPTYNQYEQSSPSLNPSTPSSTTLNSDFSASRPSRMLRRSISSLSNSSDQLMAPTVNPSVRRLRRSDTFVGPPLFPTGLKRAPSYGGSSRNSLESVAMSIDFNARDSDNTSDEEEKFRNRKAKRARRKANSPSPTPPPLSPPVLDSPSPNPTARPKKSQKTSNSASAVAAGKVDNTENKRAQRKKPTFQRHSSIIGPELPNPQQTPQSPTSQSPTSARVPRTSHVPGSDASRHLSPASPVVYRAMPSSPYNLTHIPSVSPETPRTLRRSRPIAPLPRTSLARKISFNTLAATADENGGSGAGLGSAFQLH